MTIIQLKPVRNLLLCLGSVVLSTSVSYADVQTFHYAPQGQGTTYSTLGATIHKIDIDPTTGGGSQDPDVAEHVAPDTSGNKYIVGQVNEAVVLGEDSGHTDEWASSYRANGLVEPAYTHRDVGDFIYAKWELPTGTGVRAAKISYLNERGEYSSENMWTGDLPELRSSISNVYDNWPAADTFWAFEVNGILTQCEGSTMYGGYAPGAYDRPTTLPWLLNLQGWTYEQLPSRILNSRAWGWGSLYTYMPGYLKGVKHTMLNDGDIADNQGIILYNFGDASPYKQQDLTGGDGQDSYDVQWLIDFYDKPTVKQQIRSMFGVIFLKAKAPTQNPIIPPTDNSVRKWEIGKETPSGFTWNIGAAMNGSKPEFDVGVGIPATEDIKNGFVANAWYGKVKGAEKTVEKAYTMEWHCPAIYWKRVKVSSNPTVYDLQDFPYSREPKLATKRTGTYQYIYHADLKELNNVVVDSGAYGDNGPIEYDPDDVNYGSVPIELLINGKKLETPTAYKEEYTPNEDDHVVWPAEPPMQSKSQIDTGRSKRSADYFIKYWNLQEEADNTELLTVTTYSDKIVVNNKTYLAGGSASSHSAFQPAKAPQEVAIYNGQVTSNTGSGGDYLQRNNNRTITIPADVKNGKYQTKLTLNYARMVPKDNNIKSTVTYGQAAILNESMYGKNLKGNEEVIVDTPVISPIKIIDPENKTQLVKSPNPSAYKLLLDGTYTLQFQPEVWESERRSDSGSATLDGYENDEDRADRYDRYVAHKRVRFPFPVEAADITDSDTVKYWPVTATGFTEWIEIPKYSNILKFYIPTWVTETNTLDKNNQRVYTAEFRVESISSDGVSDTTEEEEINTELANHVSTYTIDMTISGSIYDFKIIGTSDKDMFAGYTEDINEEQNYPFVPNKEEKRVGTKNRFGKNYIRYAYDGSVTSEWSTTNTLPLRNGTSNKYKQMGSLWKGTTFSFSFKTIANLGDMNDSIVIKPRYTYVTMTNNPDGTKVNKTYQNDELVMFYSDEKGNYIKVGSAQDQNEHKRYVLLGNRQFRGSWYMGGKLESWFTSLERDQMTRLYGSNYLDLIPDDISYTTGKLGKTNIEFMNAKNYAYSMSDIKLDKNLRILSGDREQLERNQSKIRTDSTFDNITDMVGTDSGKVTEETFRDSMQTWYGQFTIPQKLYITTVDRLNAVGGLEKYARNGKLSEDADLWLNDGYLIIGFDITTKNGGNDHLSYNAPNGVDMWDSDHEGQIEKIKLPPQTKPMSDGSVPDSTPREIPIKHGDIVVVDLRYKQSDKVSARTFMIN